MEHKRRRLSPLLAYIGFYLHSSFLDVINLIFTPKVMFSCYQEYNTEADSQANLAVHLKGNLVLYSLSSLILTWAFSYSSLACLTNYNGVQLVTLKLNVT